MMITRINMSQEEKAKFREKATDGMKRYRQAMSPEEMAKSREMETIARKRQRHGMLKVKKKMLIVSRRQKNIYAELNILSILTNIKLLFVSFVINLLLVQRQFTTCQRTILLLMKKDYLWKVMRDIMAQSSNPK
jgi:hypothetical protein